MTSEYFDVQRVVIPCQHIREYPGATRDGLNHALQLSVKRYVPKEKNKTSGDAITILAAGGNGFPKELYEPLWEELLLRSRDGNFSIRAIWIADMAHQGQSGILNGGILGDDPSWFDNARDLLQVVNHFRDEMKTPIFGIGHSIGANALINLSIFHPRLLTHLILFEPILGDCTKEGVFFAHHALRKPDHWPSGQMAKEAFLKAPPFNSWDPCVFDRWLEHGLTDCANGDVELTSSKHQEAVTYVRPLWNEIQEKGRKSGGKIVYPDVDNEVDRGRSFYCPEAMIAMAKLPELRPEILYIFGGRSVMSPSHRRERIVETSGIGVGGNGGQRQGSVESNILPDCGHLLVFETPHLCAQVVGEYCRNVDRFHDERTTLRQSFEMSSMEVSQRWRDAAAHQLRAMESKGKL